MDSHFLDLASKVQGACDELDGAIEAAEEAQGESTGELNWDLVAVKSRLKDARRALEESLTAYATVRDAIAADQQREDDADAAADRASY